MEANEAMIDDCEASFSGQLRGSNGPTLGAQMDESLDLCVHRHSDASSLVVLRDCTNAMREDQVDELFVSPPTPKHNPTHRNYVNRTHIVLTAAERLEEMRLLEERKKQQTEFKKKKAEMREIRKKEKESEAEERKKLKLSREKEKQLMIQLKKEKVLKRKQEKEKKESEKNNKKQRLAKILFQQLEIDY